MRHPGETFLFTLDQLTVVIRDRGGKKKVSGTTNSSVRVKKEAITWELSSYVASSVALSECRHPHIDEFLQADWLVFILSSTVGRVTQFVLSKLGMQQFIEFFQ